MVEPTEAAGSSFRLLRNDVFVGELVEVRHLEWQAVCGLCDWRGSIWVVTEVRWAFDQLFDHLGEHHPVPPGPRLDEAVRLARELAFHADDVAVADVCELELERRGGLPGPLVRVLLERLRAVTDRFMPYDEVSALLNETDDRSFAAQAEVTLNHYGWLPPQVTSDAFRRLSGAAGGTSRLGQAATREDVVAHADQLRALAAQAGLSALRVGPGGSVVVHDPEPGLRNLARFHTDASQLVGAWVRVITDDAPGAAGSADWPEL